MRSPARVLVGATVVALLVSCSPGSTDKKPEAGHPTGYEATGAWDAGYMKLIHGLTGSFSSLVTGTPCTEPITKPCVVGGFQVSDSGVFANGPKTASYVHRAVGKEADPSEAQGYRTLVLASGTAYVSAIGRTSRGGCWAPTASVPEFGSRWKPMPLGFDILLDADPDNDPAVGSKKKRFSGTADLDLVLQFLGLVHLYVDAAGHYGWHANRVPVELRMGSDGLPSGFAVDGASVAEALVGPDPKLGTNAPAVFRSDEVDALWDAEVRGNLAPLRGEFNLFDLGTEHTFEAPPKHLVLHHRARGNDPCPRSH